MPGIHHWVKSPHLKVCAGVPAPGELVSFFLGLGDTRLYRVFAPSQQGVGFGHKVTQRLGCAEPGHLKEGPRAPQGIAAARGKVPSPHPPSQADTHVAALSAPLISPRKPQLLPQRAGKPH